MEVYRLAREKDGELVEIEEIEAETLEDALEVYWSWHTRGVQ